MAKAKILITVKTYPTLSTKYDETVCTAGFLEDGSWIRIYPIPFRKKKYEEQYKKYDWIEIDVTRNNKDLRKESYRPATIDTPIQRVDHLGTEQNWRLRKQIVLKKRFYINMDELITEARSDGKTSLAVFKPTQVKDFVWKEEEEREWDKTKLVEIQHLRETDIFRQLEKEDKIFEVVKKLPYKFYYKFTDCTGKESKLMIEDWEIGTLFWNCLKKHEGNETKALADVRKKYFDDFAKTKDLYLFLGTTKKFHEIGKNPFIIIGTFTPKIETQLSFDF